MNQTQDRVTINLMDEFRKTSGQPLTGTGWAKLITGIDKTQTNGFSLKGDFIKASQTTAEREPGVYLDCNMEMGRKVYRLFYLWPDGRMQFVFMTPHEDEWAKKCWPAIEAWDKVPLPPLPVQADYPATTPKTEAPAVLRSDWTDEMLQHEIALCNAELDRRAKERARAATLPVPETLSEDDNAIPEGAEEALQDMFDAFADAF